MAYSAIWNVVERLLIAFPSFYLVEGGFRAVMNLLTKKKKKLNRPEICARGDLRLLLTSVKPDILKIVELHQIHPIH